MTRSTYDFNNGTDGTYLSTGSWAGFDIVDSNKFTFTTATPATGLGVSFSDVGYGRMGMLWSSRTSVYTSFRMKQLTKDAGQPVFATFFQDSTALAQLRWVTADSIGMRNGTTTVDTSIVLSNATDYRIEWWCNRAGGTQECRIYAGWGTTPIDTLTGACTTGTGGITAINIGAIAGGTSGGTRLIDDIGWDDTGWLGATAISSPPATTIRSVSAFEVPVATSGAAVRSSSAFEVPVATSGAAVRSSQAFEVLVAASIAQAVAANDLWVWNGTAEVPANVTVWSGTSEVASSVSVV